MKVKMLPCPVHKEKTPSLAFYDDGYDTHWHCYGCGWHVYGVDYLIETEGLSVKDAIKEAQLRGWRRPDDGTYQSRKPDHVAGRERHGDSHNEEPAAQSEHSRSDQSEYGLQLWNESKPAADTPVEQYFASRGIPRVPPSIRYHPDAWKRELKKGLPAAICSLDDGETVGSVHVLWLEKHRGVWRKERTGRKSATMGAMNGQTVKFGVPDDTIVVAEGAETAMSASMIYRHPAEAVCGNRNILNWNPREGIKHIILAVDNDDSLEHGDWLPEKSTMDAFCDRAKELMAAGYKVSMVAPNHGAKDFNDMIQADPDCRRYAKPLPYTTPEGSVANVQDNSVEYFESELAELVEAGSLTQDAADKMLNEYVEQGYGLE